MISDHTRHHYAPVCSAYEGQPSGSSFWNRGRKETSVWRFSHVQAGDGVSGRIRMRTFCRKGCISLARNFGSACLQNIKSGYFFLFPF